MTRTIVYFDDYLGLKRPDKLEIRTLRYLQEKLRPMRTDVLGFNDDKTALPYMLDPSHKPSLIICDHNLFFGKEPLLADEYSYRYGYEWMFHLRTERPDLKEVPIIIYTDDPKNAEFEWTCRMLAVPYTACVPKYNYEGPEETRLEPWEILLQEILHSPPFIEGSPKVEGRR